MSGTLRDPEWERVDEWGCEARKECVEMNELNW